MLKKVRVEQLYDLYTYELDLENADNSPMKFITGPNGYGKSTMLNMIYAVLTHDCDVLFNTPFKQFQLTFDDAVVTLTQKREYTQDDRSDIEKLVRQSMHIEYKTSSGEVEEGDMEPKGECPMPDLIMYLSGISAYYMDDKRVVHNTIDAKKENISDVVGRLNEDAMVLRELIDVHQIDFSSPVFENGEAISEKDYKERVERISETLKPLKRWGMVNPEFEPITYMPVVDNILRTYLDNLEYKIDIHKEFINQLRMFESLVANSFFANKTLRINSKFGFCFYSEAEHKEPLLPENLSSGERHLLLQLFELIFRAPNSALVLIDEPELSMHLYWQICYSKVLEEIANARKLHCVVATHSPQIFDSMWSRCVDLYQLTKAAK